MMRWTAPAASIEDNAPLTRFRHSIPHCDALDFCLSLSQFAYELRQGISARVDIEPPQAAIAIEVENMPTIVTARDPE